MSEGTKMPQPMTSVDTIQKGWEYVSRDGIWTYEREEYVGTLWVVTHKPTGVKLTAASLPKARRYTATCALTEVNNKLDEAKLPHTSRECPIYPAPCAVCDAARQAA